MLGAGAADQLDQPARDHLLLLGVPLLALAVDVDPDPHPLLVVERVIGDLGRQLAVLRLLELVDQHLGVGPAPVAVDDPELVAQRGVGLEQQRLEDALVGLDLALQLGILLGADPRLLVVGQDIVEIDDRSPGLDDRAAEPPLLPDGGRVNHRRVRRRCH